MWKARRWLKGLFGRKTVDKNRRNSAPANPPLPLADVAGDNAPREWAAVVIQCHFRAYLSRKALRALKGLVKLQALIRGYIVRKQTAYVLQRLEALIRAQARTRVRTHSTITSTTYQKTWIHHKEPEEWEKKSAMRSHSTKLYDKSPQHKGHFYSSYHNKSRPRTPSYGELETLSRFESPLYPDCDDNDSFSSVLYSTPSSRKEGFTSTPTKRVGTRSCYYGDYPSYMAYTESSRAKMRAFSVPRNRPLTLFERSFSSRGCSDSPARSSPSIANRAYSISGY